MRGLSIGVKHPIGRRLDRGRLTHGGPGVVAVVIAEEQEEFRRGAVLTDDGVEGGHGDSPHEHVNVPTPGQWVRHPNLPTEPSLASCPR